MKILILILKKLRENKFIYIFLALQLVIGMYTANTGIAKYRYNNYVFDTCGDIVNQKPLILSTKDELSGPIPNLAKQKEILNQIENLPNVKNVTVCRDSTFQLDKISVTLLAYDTYILSMIKRPLSNGTWMDKAANADNTNAVVIDSSLADRYKVGDIFTINKLDDNQGNEHTAKFKVCGILALPSYAWDFSIGSSIPNIQMYLRNQHNNILSGPVKDINGKIIDFHISLQNLVFLENPNIGQQTLDKIESGFKQYYDVNSMDSAVERGRADSHETTFTWSLYSLINLMLIIFGVGGCTILMLQQQLKEYGIYILCGASKKRLLLVKTLINVIVIFFPSLISLFAVMHNSNSYMLLDIYSVYICLGLCTFIFAITTGLALVKLYRQQPVEIIRRSV